MPHPQSGDTVVVHYTGRLGDGRVFGTSRDRAPLELVVGGGNLIPVVEETLAGMEPGDARTIMIPAERVYGPHRPDLVFAVSRSELPPGLEPELGQQLRVRQEDGETTVVTIAGVSAEQVVIDANHPLAGENLTFDLELVKIRSK